MKKIKIASIVLIVAFLSYFYIYIPTNLKVSTYKVSNVYELSINRLLSDPKLLQQSLGNYYDSTNHQMVVNGIHFSIKPALSNLVQIDIASTNMKVPSFLTVNSVTKETSAIHWFFESKTTWNPIQRWKDYQEAIVIKKTLSEILNSLNTFVEQPKNIYGFDIKEVTLQDTVLITTKFVNKNLPSNEQIYTQVTALNNYLTKYQKKAINNPMVTVLENSTNDYTIMVGISINGEIPETNQYRIKRMPVNGKMFIADVEGGNKNVLAGYSALKNYLIDSKRPSPAVPFELHLTNRNQIKDSTEWKTRIYYPVM